MKASFGSQRLLTRTMLLLALCLPLATLLAPKAEAAHIRLNPASIAVALEPGKSATVPFSATLTAASRGDYSVFSLAGISGEAITWFDKSPSLSLSANTTTSTALTLHVPEGIPGGSYTARFSPVETASGRANTADELIVTIEVPETRICKQAPIISALNATQTTLKPQPDKPYKLVLSGKITQGENCSSEAWYDLSDEYNELSADHVTFALQPDGSFSFNITIVASRKGLDKDGRNYTVTLNAANEAGNASPKAVSLLVAHDNRK